MKKAFVFILLAAITLSACRPHDIPSNANNNNPADNTPTVQTTVRNNIPDNSSASEDAIPNTEPIIEDVVSTTSRPVAIEQPVTVPTEEIITEQATTQPEHTEPQQEVTVTVKEHTPPSEPFEPALSNPAPTDPPVTEPETTEQNPTEPTPTEPVAEVIDIETLESYGRSYASGTYGYNGTSACNPNTGAGYFPGATKEILTMDDGYRLVQQAIDSQYRRDMAYGYSPFEEINGVIVRCPINIRVEPTGQPYVYIIWVYYGGDA